MSAAVTSALHPVRILPAPRTRPPLLVEEEPAGLREGPTWLGPGGAGAFGGACGGVPSHPRGPAYVQEPLAVDFELCSDEQLFGEQPTRRRDLPDPRQWAGHIAQALVEVMAGVRPAPQVLRWTTTEVYAVVARRAMVSTRRQGATRRTLVRSVRVCEPADGVAEVSAVVLDGARVRALALRLVGLDGRWRVEALQVG